MARFVALAPVMVSVLVALVSARAVPVHAAELPAEAQYQQQPRADHAEQAARHWLAKGQIARAINWVERMVRSPGATAEQTAWAAKVRGDLRWKLADQGYGLVTVQVRPAQAVVTVDGRELLPRTGFHAVWLQEGSHQVAATLADHGAAEQVVTAARGEKRTVDLVLPLTRPPALLVRAQPECEVWLDGTFLGRSSKQRFVVKPGEHLLELRAEGFLSWVKTLRLSLGDELPIDAALIARNSNVGNDRGRASQVDRELTERELSETGESIELGRRPGVDSPLDGQMDQRVQVEGKAAGVPKGRASTGPALETADRGSDSGPAPREQVAVEAGVSGDAERPSTPWKATTKGWMWNSVGLLAAGAGGYLALTAVRQAERANQEIPLGDTDFDAAYDTAEANAYLGYGIAAGGVAMMAVGNAYLLGSKGHSRTGKGVLLTTYGLLAGGLAATLWLDASEVAESTEGLSSKHWDLQRRSDLADRNSLIAYGVGGGATALIGAGVYLMLTGDGGGRSARVDDEATEGWALAPWLTGGTGLSARLGW